jgi:hypothetical protein
LKALHYNDHRPDSHDCRAVCRPFTFRQANIVIL